MDTAVGMGAAVAINPGVCVDDPQYEMPVDFA